MTNFLARFHIWTLDIDAVARALAATIFDEYEVAVLEPTATRQFLRTRYMRLVAAYGLPAGAVDAVADRAWSLCAKAREIPVVPEREFAFFE